MSKSPEAYKTIFTLWWFIDTFYYGFLIGALAIVNVCLSGRGVDGVMLIETACGPVRDRHLGPRQRGPGHWMQ